MLRLRSTHKRMRPSAPPHFSWLRVRELRSVWARQDMGGSHVRSCIAGSRAPQSNHLGVGSAVKDPIFSQPKSLFQPARCRPGPSAQLLMCVHAQPALPPIIFSMIQYVAPFISTDAGFCTPKTRRSRAACGKQQWS
jgi:hypothetical protein